METQPGKGKKEGGQAQTAQTEAKAWPRHVPPTVPLHGPQPSSQQEGTRT